MPLLRPALVSLNTLLLCPVIQKTDRGNKPLQTLDGARMLFSPCTLIISVISCLVWTAWLWNAGTTEKGLKKIHCTDVYKTWLCKKHLYYIPILLYKHNRLDWCCSFSRAFHLKCEKCNTLNSSTAIYFAKWCLTLQNLQTTSPWFSLFSIILKSVFLSCHKLMCHFSGLLIHWRCVLELHAFQLAKNISFFSSKCSFFPTFSLCCSEFLPQHLNFSIISSMYKEWILFYLACLKYIYIFFFGCQKF